MTPADLDFLLSAGGRRHLAEMTATPITENNHLAVAAALRRQLAPEHARAVVEMAWLRQRATGKFSRALQMFFTRDGLEQASGETIAAYRSRRFDRSDIKRIVDLGCGIGGDALALARHAAVLGIDRSHLRLRLARENVKAYEGAPFTPLAADITQLSPPDADAIFFDPARRDAHGRRLRSVHMYQPPLSLIDRWRARIPAAAVKISPAVAADQLPPDAEVEFISVAGALKEAVLWYGPFQGARRRATLLPAGHTLASDAEPAPLPLAGPGPFLYEPDAAVIRAGLLDLVAHQIDAAQIDREIAYLTADAYRETPFARCFAIDDVIPFQLKRLRRYLRERDVGLVTIKKRGSPLDVEQLRTRLRLKGDGQRTLFLTYVAGTPSVLIGRPYVEVVSR